MKPTVSFVRNALDIIEIGMPAIIHGVKDHPSSLVSNHRAILTSLVVRVFDDGFETENTRYVATEVQ